VQASASEMEDKRREGRPADRERCGILLDFDHTLFDTDRFFWVDLKSAFTRFGIPDDAWESSYDAIWRSGYSLVKHFDELARVSAIRGPDLRKTMLAAFDADFSDLRPYLFPDVPGFLKAARDRGFDLILLSFGDTAWQSYKVQASGITPLFQRIVYTAKPHGKAEMVDEIGSRYRALYAIDNNPADLDAMKARNSDLQTHLICRVETLSPEESDRKDPDRFREAARYLTIPARLPHHRCRSLDEVSL